MVRSSRRATPTPKIKKNEVHTCGECGWVTIVTRFHTLSIKGEPTMGECPHWKESRCVLLRQKSCNHFKQKKIATGEL